MKSPSQMSRTAKLVEAAMMVGLSFALSAIPAFKLPYGGSATLFSTLPIILVGLRHGSKWGVATTTLYGFTQLLQGMGNIMFLQTAGTMLLCALLDYILPYTFLGFTGAIARRFKNNTIGVGVGIVATGAIRLLCSFLSGIILWSQYAPEGTPVWVYSLTYNAGWCVPDVAMVLIAGIILSRVKILQLGKSQL